MGGYLQSEERLELAARAYETAFSYGQVDPETWHVTDIRDIAAVCLSLVLQLQERDDDAEPRLRRALDANPLSLRVRRHMIDLCIKHDRRQQALAEVDRLPSDTPHRDALRGAVRGACLAVQQDWAAALKFLQTAHQAGCRDIVCLRWLSITHMALGDTVAADEILRQWYAIDPRNQELSSYLSAADMPGMASRPAATSDAAGHQLRLDVASSVAGAAAGPLSPATLSSQAAV